MEEDINFIIQEDLVILKKKGEEGLKSLESELSQEDPRNLSLKIIRSEIASILNLSKIEALKGLCNEIYISNTETHFKFFEEGKINKLILDLQVKLSNIANFTKEESRIRVVKRNSLDLKAYQISLQPYLDKFNKIIQTTQVRIRENINSVDVKMRVKYKAKLKELIDYLNKNSKAIFKKYSDVLK